MWKGGPTLGPSISGQRQTFFFCRNLINQIVMRHKLGKFLKNVSWPQNLLTMPKYGYTLPVVIPYTHYVLKEELRAGQIILILIYMFISWPNLCQLCIPSWMSMCNLLKMLDRDLFIKVTGIKEVSTTQTQYFWFDYNKVCYNCVNDVYFEETEPGNEWPWPIYSMSLEQIIYWF